MTDLFLLDSLKQRLGVTHDKQDTYFQTLLDGVSAAVEAFIGRKLEAADFVERYNGNGKNRLVLEQWPVISVSSVKINGRAVDDWDFDNWLLIRHACFAQGIRNVEVSYRAGYETMPADIQEAVLIIATQRLNEIENKGVQSKSLAGETISFSSFSQSGGIPPSAYAILTEYKRKAV